MNSIMHLNERNRLHSHNFEFIPKEKMPYRPNEIVVKWLYSKEDGKTHHVNVKHITGRAEVTVRFNVRCYRGTVADLLDWPLLRTDK